jgi:hypothetical protein
MIGRLLVALALAAALLGAPSRAFAAGNELTAPQVSPTSGTTATVFTLQVTYAGRAAAVAVTAAVGPMVVAMARISGTAEAGMWSASTTLPAGSWQPAFTATVVQGNEPTLAGPTVFVVATGATVATPSAAPSASARDAPTGTRSGEPVGGGSTSTPPPAAPATAPVPSADALPGGLAEPSSAASSQTAGAAPASTAATPGGTGDAPGAGGAGGAGGAPDARAPITERPAPPQESSATPGHSAAREDAGPDAGPDATAVAGTIGRGTRNVGDELHGLPPVAVLAGISALALLGTSLLLAGRRRRRDPHAARDAIGTPPGVTVSDRSARRRARMEMADDPIIAAMGLGASAKDPHGTSGRERGEAPDRKERRRP